MVTPTSVLLAPNIIGPTPTLGTPPAGKPQVLIPVTGMDLTEKQNNQQAFITRTRQLQSGMGFLGFGLMLIGLTLMIGKKEDY